MLLHVSVILSTGEGVGFPACVTGHMTGESASRGRGLHGGIWIQEEGGSVSMGGGGSASWGKRVFILGFLDSGWYALYWNTFLSVIFIKPLIFTQAKNSFEIDKVYSRVSFSPPYWFVVHSIYKWKLYIETVCISIYYHHRDRYAIFWSAFLF